MFTDNQPLTLHKLMGMGCIVIVTAIYLSGTDDLDQLLALLSKFFKLSCLYCRGMCTQKLFRIYVKGILHIPRRVILWYVGTLKVIEIHLYFRAFLYRVAQTDE